ncbi:hypothetical protein PRIPAC_87740 [Pristionchus pacificus]|uniref:Uncharacterized protein n=1 Tax=Pristionchus pacificus TaxID=54126 RepID=A0A2A6B904_PRIPA|nr:hypothetical protein PRIPAC_87740 [Pristionchus pacificus]|eukprot:PDM62372.1 hypothetical protein PRIPAC_51814 [Pristionchus pacificus]
MHLSTPISAPGSERAKITVQLDFSLKTIRPGPSRDGPRLSKIIPDLSTLLWRSAAMMFALEELHKIAYDMKNFYIESSSLGHPEALFTHLVYVTGVEQPGRATAGDP